LTIRIESVKGNTERGDDARTSRADYPVRRVKDVQPALGVRLRRIRLSKGLTQREVAAPNYTHAYISTIEAGRRHPSEDALGHFADRLGVDVEALASGRPPGLVQELEAELDEARIAASDGRLEEAEASISSIAKRARRYRIARTEARAREIRALMLERAGKFDDALEEYEAADELLQDENASARVEAVAGKARCLQALGDGRYAIFLLESLRSQMTSRETDAGAAAHVDAALLNAYLDGGLVRVARDAAGRLELLAPRVRTDVRRGQMDVYLARLRAEEGRTRDADALLATAATAFERSGLRTETGYAHLARGILASRRSKHPQASKELEQARAVFEATRAERDLNNTLIELARVERLRGHTDEAIRLLEVVLERVDDGDPQLLGWAHREYALLSTEDRDVSEKHLRLALELFDGAEDHIESAATFRLLGDLLMADGRREAAFEAYSVGIHRLPADA
jgi:tetratricopeptide (TPR) repeat protein